MHEVSRRNPPSSGLSTSLVGMMTARFTAKLKADHPVPLGELAEVGLPASGLRLALSWSFAVWMGIEAPVTCADSGEAR